jgi:hypothetical protein
MANSLLSTKVAGSIIKIKESGSPVEFIVCKHDYESELNGSGRTLVVRKDCYDNRQWHSSNVNAYATSDIDAWFNSTYKNLLDADIRGAIGTTKFKYTPGNGNNIVSTLERAIFSLSATELNKSESWFNVEGTALEIASSLKIAYMNGSAVVQWTRSPFRNSRDYACHLNSDGTVDANYCASSYGSRPAFTLPSDALVDDSGNVVIPNLTAHKTLVNGTTYTVKSGKCMVGGTVYNILKGRTLIDGTGYDITFAPPYDPVFANNTWEQIIAACHNNEVPETWKVADQKPMTIGGTDYLIDIIGENHDDYSDGSGKAPLTFQLHDCYKLAKAMHSTAANTMGWTQCSMRVEHLPIILKQMPADVQSGIREVNKISSSGGKKPSLETTKDNLFLLSEVEVFGSSSNSLSGEGTQYDYYKAGNSTVKNFNGSAYDWWERSPTANSTRYYCNVKSTGSSVNSSANVTRGVAFGFCF